MRQQHQREFVRQFVYAVSGCARERKRHLRKRRVRLSMQHGLWGLRKLLLQNTYVDTTH